MLEPLLLGRLAKVVGSAESAAAAVAAVIASATGDATAALDACLRLAKDQSNTSDTNGIATVAAVVFAAAVAAPRPARRSLMNAFHALHKVTPAMVEAACAALVEAVLAQPPALRMVQWLTETMEVHSRLDTAVFHPHLTSICEWLFTCRDSRLAAQTTVIRALQVVTRQHGPLIIVGPEPLRLRLAHYLSLVAVSNQNGEIVAFAAMAMINLIKAAAVLDAACAGGEAACEAACEAAVLAHVFFQVPLMGAPGDSLRLLIGALTGSQREAVSTLSRYQFARTAQMSVSLAVLTVPLRPMGSLLTTFVAPSVMAACAASNPPYEQMVAIQSLTALVEKYTLALKGGHMSSIDLPPQFVDHLEETLWDNIEHPVEVSGMRLHILISYVRY